MQCPISLNVSNHPSLPSDYQYMILCENSPLHSLNYNFTELHSYLQGVLRKDIQGGETSLKVQGRHAVPQTINLTFPRRLNLRLRYLFHCNISSTRTRERWHSNPQPIASLVFPKVANSNIDQTLMHILSKEYALLRRISHWPESLNRVPRGCIPPVKREHHLTCQKLSKRPSMPPS